MTGNEEISDWKEFVLSSKDCLKNSWKVGNCLHVLRADVS